jgi:alanine racemase
MLNRPAVSRFAPAPLTTAGEASPSLRAERAGGHAPVPAAPGSLPQLARRTGHANALPGRRDAVPALAAIDGTVLSNEPQRRKEAAGAMATLDLGAVRRNFRTGWLDRGTDVPPAVPITVDDHGLGVRRAKALVEEGCRKFIVARSTEAVVLRKALHDELPGLATDVGIKVLDDSVAGSDPPRLGKRRRISPPHAGESPAAPQADSGRNSAGTSAAHGCSAPGPDSAGSRPLEPELALQSRIAQVRELQPTDAIGYGQRYVVDRPMQVATILIGYADGLPRVGGGNRPGDAPTRAHVLVDGRYPAPLVGATSMDLTTIDVSAVPPEARREGTPVTVIGSGLTAADLGRMYGISASEVPAKLAGRVHLEVRDEARLPEAAAPQRAFAHPWDVEPARAAAPAPLRRQAIENLWAERLAKEENLLANDAAGAVATLNLGAVRRNFRTGLQKLGRDVTPAAVIKADGYGLGAVRLAKVLIQEGCRDFFVARVSEGVDLRKALGKELPALAHKVAINVLDGNLAGCDPQWLVEHRLTPVLNSLEQVRQWNETGRAQARQLPAILQVDTGLNRSGMPDAELQALLADRRQYLGHVKLQFIMSHLANAGEVAQGPDGTPQPGEVTRRQLARFDDIRKHFPGIKASIGASSTVYLDRSLHKDMVRMGGIFHGQAPFDADGNPLEPVLTLETKIAQVRELSQSEAATPGLGRAVGQPVLLATVPIGSADGLSGVAGASGQAYMLVDGKHKAPLVGDVSMDYATIDVSGVPSAALEAGTPVTVIGGGITTDHLGLMYGTNASETQTKLAGRVHKVIVDEAAPPAADSRRVSDNVWSRLNP